VDVIEASGEFFEQTEFARASGGKPDGGASISKGQFAVTGMTRYNER
jgi:hypothetical protein